MYRTRRLRLRMLTMTTACLMTLGLVATQAGAAAPSKTVPPKKWAKTVCPALADFVDSFNAIDSSLAGGVSPPEAQELIISGIEGTIGVADDVIAAVKKAGTPDAKKGKQAAATFTKEFKNIMDTLVGAQALIVDLPTDDLDTFATESQAIRDQVLEEFDTSFEKFDEIDAKVEKAINADTACKAIAG
jgi:hypothetical protein